MGRTPGSGKNKSQQWTQQTTAGGFVYWTRSDQPGWGYIDDPTKEGLQPGTTAYPIDFINYVWGEGGGGNTKNPRESKAGQQARELTASALEGIITVPYGRCRVGGAVVAWRALAWQLWMSMALGHGPIQGLVGIRMFDQDTSLVGGAPFYGAALFQTELGLANPAGPVPSYYSDATGGGGVERFPYLATSHALLSLNPGNGLPGAPNPLHFIIDGRTLRDPRLGLDGNGIPSQPEAFSENPALALADYYTSRIYGMGTPDNRINWDSVAEAANYCDVLVAGEKRHTINWAISRQSTHRAITSAIKGLCRLVVLRRDGKRVFVPEKAATRVHVFTPSNSLVIDMDPAPLSRAPNTVKVIFTNPSKNYGDDEAVARTEAARTGAEPPRIEEFPFEGIDNKSEAQRMAAWLLAERRNPFRATVEATKAEGMKFEVMDRVGVYSPTAMLGTSAVAPQDMRVVKAIRRGDTGRMRFICKKYDENYFSDATAPTEGDSGVATVSPVATPTAPKSPAGAASLTVGDGFTLVGPTTATVNWTHDGWPYSLTYRVTRQEAGGSEATIFQGSAGPVRFEVNPFAAVTIRVYALVAATMASSVACSGSANPALLYPTPEWPVHYGIYENAQSLVDFILGTGGVYEPVLSFRPPQTRTRTQYGAASWSHSGITGWDASLVNNGNTSAVAGTATDNDSITLDAGSAIKVREFDLWFTAHDPASPPTTINEEPIDSISYSDNGTSWTEVFLSETYQDYYGPGDTSAKVNGQIDDYGSHRYWKVRFNTQAGGVTSYDVRELQFYTWTGEAVSIVSFNVYDFTTGVPALIASLPADGDYETTKLRLLPYARIQSGSSNTYKLAIRVRSVDARGVESEPLDDFRTWPFATYLVSAAATVSGTEILRNKSISGAENTITNLGTSTLSDNAVTNAKLRDSVATSVIGRSANSTGDPADIVSTNDGEFLYREGGLVVFARPTAFDLFIYNTAGVIEHQIFGFNASRIIGATGAIGTTPTVSSTVDFVEGAGIDSAFAHHFVLNTAAQLSAEDQMFQAYIIDNPTGSGAIWVQPSSLSKNVNGVTRIWKMLAFKSNSTTPPNRWLINTTNIPAGKWIGVRCFGHIR